MRFKTHICRLVLVNSKRRLKDTPWSHYQQVNVPSDTCIRSMHRLKSFYLRWWYWNGYPVSRMKVVDVDRRSEGNRGYIRHHSTASFDRHQGPRNFVHHCSCLADLFPKLASPRRHLFNENMLMTSEMLHSLIQGQVSACND